MGEIDTSEIRPGRYLKADRRWYRIDGPVEDSGSWPAVQVMTPDALRMPLRLYSTPVVQDEIPGPFQPSALHRKALAASKRIEDEQRRYKRLRSLTEQQEAAKAGWR